MKHFVLAALFLFGLSSFAHHVPREEASKRIAQAVELFKGVAASGIEEYAIEPVQTEREALEQIADEPIEEENWQGATGDPWEIDSSNWGIESMKGAYQYLALAGQDDPDTPEFKQAIRDAKKGFELLQHTGVKFGVAPLGATQCGIRFAALVVIDPQGKAYVVAREGSGC